MDVTNQFPEIDVFLADDEFIAVLKKLPVPLVPSIEIDHIPFQKPSHQGREPFPPPIGTENGHGWRERPMRSRLYL